MSTENTNTEEVVEATSPSEEQPKAVLLGAISYSDYSEYEKFLNGLDINQSIFVLIASCNHAQAKGAYNLDESELVAKAIKTIKKATNSSEKATSTDEPNTEK